MMTQCFFFSVFLPKLSNYLINENRDKIFELAVLPSVGYGNDVVMYFKQFVLSLTVGNTYD